VSVSKARRLLEAAEEATDRGAFARAVSLFRSAVRLDPHLPSVYLRLANLYLAMALDREAGRCAREALTRAVAAGDVSTGSAAFSFLVSMALPADPH
jgi:cytochrome c-type biogenesis protein CcmH/NrfG